MKFILIEIVLFKVYIIIIYWYVILWRIFERLLRLIYFNLFGFYNIVLFFKIEFKDFLEGMKSILFD